jgi:signal transduction histidine kinase/DNA-binding NarL/FixJ family response regulator
MTHQPDENLTSKSNSPFLGIFIDAWKKPQQVFKNINHNINSLSIQKKIKFGYLTALVVAMSGSLAGIAIGDFWQNQANTERIRLRRERILLSKLRSDIISLQVVTAFPTSLQKVRNFQQAKITAIQRIYLNKKILNQIKNQTIILSNQSFQVLFEKHQDTYLEFLNNLENLLNKTEIKSLAGKQINPIIGDFRKLDESEAKQETEDFVNQLASAIEVAEKQEEKAETNLNQVRIFRIIIIFISIGASIVLVYLFVIYASKNISLPVTTITNVTQQAIKKQDFSLQVPESSTTELAKLATSINQMLYQLKTLSEAQKHAKVSADSANQAKSKFLANMSHELRTPLNGILGYAQILARSENLTEEQRHGIKTIYQCGFHLLSLINDILDLSKLESQKLELELMDFHLPSFIQGVVEICRIKAEQKGIDFIYEPQINLPIGITTDKKRLRQVLINLLSNAIKFTNAGCVKLKVQASNSKVTSNAAINFIIVDTGVGMNREQMENIFLPFEQVINSDRETEGTGLGLTLSQKVVEMMGSRIQVKSQLGVGSLFEFELDCRVADDWTETSTITSLGKIIGYSGSRKKVLIVDDYWENRSLLISLLEPLDFTVIEANNGREAIEKAFEYQPDLIISDIVMPAIDGWEMLSNIRQSELLKNTVVILTSPNIKGDEHQKTLSAGANAFLTRPIQVEELYNLLAKYLQINWIYANPSISSDDAVTVGTSEMVIPPVSDLNMLLEYARKGQIKGIKQELDKISRKDEKYQIFVRQLNKYAKNLNIQKIRAFIQENINHK